VGLVGLGVRGLWLTKYTYHLHLPYWCIWSVPPLGERETALPTEKDRYRPLACSGSVLSG
jgi:hypothetical protein